MPSPRLAMGHDPCVRGVPREKSASGCGPAGPRSTTTSTPTPLVGRPRPPWLSSSQRMLTDPAADPTGEESQSESGRPYATRCPSEFRHLVPAVAIRDVEVDDVRRLGD